MSSTRKHKNYEILNLIGYGLAKFSPNFIQSFGFNSKNKFYQHLVELGIADTVGTIKNRQDLFDPFFDNERKGWWQKGDTYIHRKLSIDSLFGQLDMKSYSNIIKLYLQENNHLDFGKSITNIPPLINSKFKQLQETGQEAEMFFMRNYKKIKLFEKGKIEDARNFGDGYDFQITVNNNYYLAEIKGIRLDAGSIRMTKNEYCKAQEYHDKYALIVISCLNDIPNMKVIFNPIEYLNFSKKEISSTQLNYHSDSLLWKEFSRG